MRDYYKLADGRYATDVDPLAGELCVIVGPRPFFVVAEEYEFRPFPEGYSWMDSDEWERAQAGMQALAPEEAYAVE